MQTNKRALILNASAGAGKTFRLVLKYICDVLENPECYNNILAVTFTNKATEEMKSRIVKELNNLASGKKSDYLAQIKATTGMSNALIKERAIEARTKILHDYSRFTVLTIDRFFQRILRAFINELSLDLNYNLELDLKMLLDRSADTLIDSIADSNNEDIRDWLLKFAEDRIQDSKRWDMRGDLSKLGSELFKEGMTDRLKSAISKKDLHDIVTNLTTNWENNRKQIIKLGEEMVETMAKNNLETTDFKGGKNSFTHHFQKYAKGEFPAPTVGIKNALESIDNWYTAKQKDKVEKVAEELIDKLREIHQLHNDYIHKANTTKLLRDNYRSYALLSDLYKSLDSVCKQENIMILDKTKELLSQFVSESNAPFIYEKVGNRYDRYMIDEFQDTSSREWNNLRPLLIEALSSNEKSSVFIVGDIKQSIYRWRGGDWRLLNDHVVRDLGKENTKVESLFDNYRSLRNIVTFNNKLIDHVKTTDNDYLNRLLTSKHAEDGNAYNISEEVVEEYTNIVNTAYSNCTQTPKNTSEEGGIAEVCVYDPEFEGEIPRYVQAVIDAKTRGYRYNDILILVRSKKQGRKVAEALYAYKNTLPENSQEADFNILTSDSLTIESCDVVKFIISTLRLAINPYDDVERAIYNHFLGFSYDKQFDEEELALFNILAHLSPLEAFELIIQRFDAKMESKYIAYIQALHEQIFAFSSNHIADIQHYLTWWDERGKNESLSIEQTDNTIEIMTIHKAKGLERDVVIIPFCKWEMTPMASMRTIVWAKAQIKGEDKNDPVYSRVTEIGEFPVAYGNAMKDSAFAEEHCKELIMSHIDGLNMLYVAVTRAKKELYMFIEQTSIADNKEIDLENISDTTPLILNAINNIEDVVVTTEKLDGTETITAKRYTFGDKIASITPKETRSGGISLTEYPSYASNITINHTTRRFTDEAMPLGTEACAKGILLHKVFEGTSTKEDLYRAIDRLKANNEVLANEAQQLRQHVDTAMQNEMVAEWFDGTWNDIKHEAEILLKGNRTHRPDRVMIKDNRVVVVDYKFGELKSTKYNKKVDKYMNLIREMGKYDTIEGYIWYVMLGEIERA